MKVEFRINGGITFYFVCWGLLLIYRSYHFVLAFTQRWVRLREWISAVLWQNLIIHVPNIQQVYSTVSIWPSYMESRTEFSQGPLSVFLIHRKSPLLIKCPNHRKKNYHHTVNELGCPRPGLITSNVRSSFKPLYVFLKHCISNNKIPEQPWGHLTSLKL